MCDMALKSYKKMSTANRWEIRMTPTGKKTYTYFHNITDTFISIYVNRIDGDYERKKKHRKRARAHKLTESELTKLK